MAHFYTRLVQEQNLNSTSRTPKPPSKFNVKLMVVVIFHKFFYLTVLTVDVCCYYN